MFPDDVWNGFNKRFKDPHADRQQAERELVKKALEALKVEAAGFVEGISECTLHLVDQVEYLTCIEVEPNDVPWELGSDEDSSEDSDGDSDEE